VGQREHMARQEFARGVLVLVATSPRRAKLVPRGMRPTDTLASIFFARVSAPTFRVVQENLRGV
jgi:hypothetical protein